MDGYILGSMIAANSIVGEQIQANSIKAANLEINVQKKIENATDTETVKALIKADLDGFESTLSREFVTVENATTQIQQATEVAVKEATQSIVNNAVTESMGAVDGQLNDKLNQYTNGILLPIVVEKAEEVLQDAENYVVTKLDSYATKSELKSSISQTRDQIELSVSEKYTTKSESATIITEAVDGITVGAINRVLGTGESKSFKFNGGANETWLPYKFSNDISNKEVYVSFKYTLTGTAQNGSQIEFAPSYLKKANNQTVYQPKNIFFASDRLQDVNISDTLSFVTRDFKDISPSSSSYIRFVGNGFTGTLSISELQIKPGNSKTSWSPAPEDTIADINDAKADAIASANNALITTIANYYTKEETESAIRVAKEEIDLGVSTKYETKGNVETKISSAKNQLNTEINKKANTTDVYFKTEVYTKDETNSRINIAKENITLAVSQDYETKDSVETKISSTLNSAKSYADTKKTEAINSAASDATSKINSAKNELNTAIGKKANITDVYNKTEVYTKTEADSRITIAKEEINLGVKNTYETKANVETKITAINVGSTNLIQGTKDFVLDNSRIKGFYNTGNFIKSTDGGFTVMTSRTQSGLTTNNILGLFSSYAPCKKGDTFTVSFWMKVTDVRAWDIKKSHIWEVYDSGKTRIEYQDVDISLTNTNKPTVTNGQWVLMTSTHKVSSSNAAYCGVRLALFRNGCIAFKKPKIETGNKATDWSPAPEDISNNIATAKSEAIASANNTLSSTIANYYTKEQTDSSIRIAKEAIELGVSTNYETKANVETKITSTLNNAKSYADTKKSEAISSANNTLNTTIANYYTKSQTDSQINVAKDSINLGVSQTYETKANVETKIKTAVNNVQVGGRNLWRFTKEYDGTKYNGWVDNNNGAAQAIAPYTTVNGFGVQRIASDWTDISQRVAIEANTDYTLSAWIKWESATGSMLFYTNTGTMGGTDVTSQVGTTDYKRVSITFNSGNATVSTCRFECNSNTPYLIYGLKLEKGTKATDWTPAPEDISADINTAKNDAIASANNTLNSTIANYYTKSQTDSAINIAKEAIDLSVSTNYETKANVETKINNIKVGATNRLAGTITSKNTNVNVPTSYITWDPYTTPNKQTLEQLGFAVGDKVTVGFNWSISKNGSNNYTYGNFRIEFKGIKADGTDNQYLGVIKNPAATFSSSNTKGRVEATVTLDSSTVRAHTLRFRVDNSVLNFKISNVKLEKGTKATSWSPAPEDTIADINDAKTTAINTASTDATNKANNAKNEAIASANNTLTTTIANYYTKAQTDSQINVAKDAINLGVSNTYETKANVETKVNSIEIGGRNLAKQTKLLTNVGLNGWTVTDTGNEGFKKLEIVTTNTSWQECNIPLYTEINTITRKVTISFEYQETSSGLLMFSFGSYNGNTRVSEIANIAVSSSFKVISTNGNWKTVCYTFDPTSVNNKSGTTQYKIQFKKASGKTGTIYVRKPKIEFGTKATSWSPAPEDISADINTAKNDAITSANNTLSSTIANYYTKEQTDSQIKVAKDAITQSVSSTYETKTNVETKVNTTLNSAKSYADTKKSEAISSAATDATNKVDSAKSELNTAINKKANSVDVYKKTEVYTKNETNSQITTAKNEINQSVSNTYETKTNVTTKLNNLSVSATNLMDNSAPLSTSGWLNWSSVSGLSTNMEVSTTDNSTHGKQGKITFSGSVTGNAGRHKLPVQKLTSGKTYSWSIWLRSGSGNLTVQLGQEQNGLRDVTVGTSWTRFTHTYTANDSQYYAFIIRPKNVTSSHSLYFHSVMLVEGDKPVAWQTSPTEVLSDKTNIEQRMSSAESKITDTAITNTIKKNFYTKTETDNQITSKGYQTSSQVQQTVDALQLKFTQSGGYNLLRNSRPEKDSSLWIADSNATITVNFTDNCLKTSGWGNRFRITTTDTSTAGVRSHRFNVKPNTKYTISGWIYSDNTTNGAALYLRTSNTLTANGSPTDSAYDASLTIVQTASQSSYKFFSKTITTDANAQSAFVKMVHRGSTTSGTSTIVAFNQLQITEGELILPWSPNPSEVYDGITTIDKNGIKVSTNKGAYTQFDSNGMTSYDNSGNQTLGIRNGGMAFYASNNHEYVGYISQSFTSAKERNGVVVGLSHYGDYLALGVSDDTDPNQGFYKPSWILLSRYDDKSENVNYGINMYQDLYMHDCSLRNSNIKYDGFKRSSSDYISFNITNQTSSSQLNLELADDSSTYFNIRANNYSDGNKYIARFNYAKGTEASNIGVHFYRAMNCHGYNITNVGNMSVYSLQSEDLEVNDIRITSPVAVASMNGRSTPTLSVVKSVDDVTEAHGIVTISNKKEKVELPLGLMFTDYYVQVTGNKVANLAVTERTDEYFIIETDSEEEIEVFYTIKAFQPNYVTRTAVYGELQGEDGTCVETYEESMEEE